MEDENKQKERNPKQNNKKTGVIIAIVAIILVVLIVASIIGTAVVLIGHNKSENNQNNVIESNKVELTTWMELYISEVKKKASELNDKGKVYMQLIKSTENAVPIMLLKYDEEENGNKTQTICALLADDEGKIEKTLIYSDVKEIKAFYNKEESDFDKKYYKYDLFIVSENDKEYTYNNVVDELYKSKANNSTTSDESNKKQFVFSKTDETLKKEKEKEFSKVYIEVEKNEEINKWVEFDKNSNQDELVKVFKEEVDKNKNIQEILTKEEKEKIAQQGAEEKKAQIEEEKKKAEEEKKKKEEANSKLKFTKYTLQYGIYKSTNPSIETITIQLNADKTCSYSGIHPDGSQKNVNSTGTFKVEFNGDDGYGNKVDWITLNLKDGTKAPFMINRDNNFGSQWLAFEYIGSANSNTNTSNVTTSNNANNNVVNNTTTNTQNAKNNTTSSNTKTSTTTTNTVKKEATSKVSDKPTMKNAISQEQALKLAQKRWGENESGNKMGYTYESWIQDEKGMQYYVFKLRWLVDNSHWSFIQTVCVSADGKTYKEIYSANNYENGEVVKQFDGEGKF